VRSWTLAVSLLGGLTGGCNTPCDTPVAVYCCPEGCRSDIGVPAVCGPSGWTCPARSVLPSQCPSGLSCGGPGPADGGTP